MDGASFDDCQEIVKTLFNDAAFKSKHCLAAINSINWARILSQIIYYFKAYFDIVKRTGGNANNVKVQVNMMMTAENNRKLKPE